jgi:hypothetical protein
MYRENYVPLASVYSVLAYAPPWSLVFSLASVSSICRIYDDTVILPVICVYDGTVTHSIVFDDVIVITFFFAQLVIYVMVPKSRSTRTRRVLVSKSYLHSQPYQHDRLQTTQGGHQLGQLVVTDSVTDRVTSQLIHGHRY